MKKKILKMTLSIAIVVYMISYVTACKTSQTITMKSGAQLWGENCMRCHNIPSPSIYSDKEWDIATTHMKLRGNLTVEETKKITEFLKIAN